MPWPSISHVYFREVSCYVIKKGIVPLWQLDFVSYRVTMDRGSNCSEEQASTSGVETGSESQRRRLSEPSVISKFALQRFDIERIPGAARQIHVKLPDGATVAYVLQMDSLSSGLWAGTLKRSGVNGPVILTVSQNDVNTFTFSGNQTPDTIIRKKSRFTTCKVYYFKLRYSFGLPSSSTNSLVQMVSGTPGRWEELFLRNLWWSPIRPRRWYPSTEESIPWARDMSGRTQSTSYLKGSTCKISLLVHVRCNKSYFPLSHVNIDSARCKRNNWKTILSPRVFVRVLNLFSKSH